MNTPVTDVRVGDLIEVAPGLWSEVVGIDSVHGGKQFIMKGYNADLWRDNDEPLNILRQSVPEPEPELEEVHAEVCMFVKVHVTRIGDVTTMDDIPEVTKGFFRQTRDPLPGLTPEMVQAAVEYVNEFFDGTCCEKGTHRDEVS